MQSHVCKEVQEASASLQPRESGKSRVSWKEEGNQAGRHLRYRDRD